ncbi:MAG: S41 family peptidase [candidate division KSB1 bacterium]|nr:S41 family peptidase [candidate division KSB1 bacterium]
MKQRSQWMKKTALCGLLVISAAAGSLFSKSQRDFYASVMRNLRIFGEVYKQTANNYVEEIDPKKFMRAGINGMLDELDPYTIFLEEEAQEDLEIMTRGKYYGVGMRISKRNGWPTVAEPPFPNSPAEKAGIREGDQIIEIDGESTRQLTLSKTAAKLRGKEKGSSVTIKIRRVGVEEPMIFTLIRDEIIVSDIQYSGIIEPGIGLVRLTVFNRGADEQLHQALDKLTDQGMKTLILDLRGNPGGLLETAVSVLELFVPRGELVVYTRGRTPGSNKEYRTSGSAPYADLPMVVLVDGYSASASEIVAGSLQDLDRAVIVGETTFGKGLVQTVLPIDRSVEGETALKLTTAKYYLPSGRLIQKRDVFKRGRNSVFLQQDSTQVSSEEEEEEWDGEGSDEKIDEKPQETAKELFKTRNGRQVVGGGGVTPDIICKNPNTTRFVTELIRRSMFFDFSLEYAAKHPELSKDLQVTDQTVQEFFKFLEAKKFDYEPTGANRIKELEKIAEREGYKEQLEPALRSLQDAFAAVKKVERERSMNDIRFLLKRELTAKVKGADMAYVVGSERDEPLKRAIEIVKDAESYRKFLAGEKSEK